ncbi:hypothetical protein Y032_0019g3795 [Ancylostoma ceylanicum]|uniref:Uncharacterized protein n=1 Tax=Ancylostoma ceylanicum TaxID=53326 RepID=A0A016V1Q5_9BILA|nr:hypothetical protein Y032_0019g3795 [Ancylostoma ceylanicum]
MEESTVSAVTTTEKATLEKLEQLIQELSSASTLVEERVAKTEQCMEIAKNVEENNKILRKFLQLANNEVKRLTQEVDTLQMELSSKPSISQTHQERPSSSSLRYRMNLICSIRVVVVALTICVCLV